MKFAHSLKWTALLTALRLYSYPKPAVDVREPRPFHRTAEDGELPPKSDIVESQLATVLFFTLNREDFSFVIHLDRQPRTSRRREAQTGSRARSGSRSERTLDAVEHSRTLMEWWPFLIFHRGGLRIKVINNTSLEGGDESANKRRNQAGMVPADRRLIKFGAPG